MILSFSAIAQHIVVKDVANEMQQIDSALDHAIALKKIGKYDSAYITLERSLAISDSLGNRHITAGIISDQGVVRMYQGRYSDALRLFLKGVKIRQGIGDTNGLAESFNLIASVYHALSDYQTAISYYNRSLELRKGLTDRKSLGITFNNIGSLNEDIGEYEIALDYHLKAMNIWQELKDTSWIAVTLRHMGYCEQQQGFYDVALVSLTHSYEMSRKTRSAVATLYSCLQIGSLYNDMGQTADARKWCEKAQEISLEIDNLYGVKESCWCLYNAYNANGQYAKALEYFQKSIEARDSIFGSERTRELTQLEMGFEFEREQLADSLRYVQAKFVQDQRIVRQQIGLASTGIMVLMAIVLAMVIYRGKKQSDHLLLNILPKAIAEELKSTGRAKATKFENVTVMFTDFKGFTEIAEQLTPEQLVGLVNECFSAFDKIALKHGIEKIKTIGDAYMAAGGIPVPSDKHAENTVNAALEIQEFMLDFANERAKRSLPYFEIRIGVHTGPVVAGIVGTTKFQYDIWGDAVNVASRMESSGAVGRVNVSQSTYEILKDKYTFEHRGKVAAKGKGQVDMYFVSRG